MSSLSDRIKQLEEKIQSISAPDVKTGEPSKVRCIPWRIIIAVGAPIILFLLLFLARPGFVQKKEGDRKVRSNARVMIWTLVLSCLVWGGMYAWGKYGGGMAAVCSVKS